MSETTDTLLLLLLHLSHLSELLSRDWQLPETETETETELSALLQGSNT